MAIQMFRNRKNHWFRWLCALFFITSAELPAQVALAQVTGVELQPLRVQIQRLTEAMDYVGNPLSPASKTKLQQAWKMDDPAKALTLVQQSLDQHCLAFVHINPESRVKVSPGPARRQLVEHGWRHFLVKVVNDAGVTAPLKVSSPQAKPIPGATQNQIADRWLELAMFDSRPLAKTLSGLKLEYRVIGLYSRDAGKRSAVLAFDVGQGTQDIGFRNDVTLTFDCAPATPVTFGIKDETQKPTMASLVIRDRQRRTYPSQPKRLAPDFSFHPQVYRFDGEQVKLPAGRYTIEIARGPEYLNQRRTIEVTDEPMRVDFELKRWIDPSKLGWWSGDHHIHAAGCAHYANPTLGVLPKDMFRHCFGEDLKVGAALTWGPCFDYQKQFFTGKEDSHSKYPYIIRYDIEVSGFGSHKSGHLCLLGLKNQIYPGGDSKHHWPTLCLNTLRWAKKQGAVCGPAHSGWGLQVETDQLPNYEIPPFNGIGANEYIVDVTHNVEGPSGKLIPAVDFLSMVDTPSIWELNMWYHTLNCGYRARISGETDFPCIYGERVGLGRSYVKIDGPLSYEAWCRGVQKGRAYVSDGRSHLIDFTVNDVELGTGQSELRLSEPAKIQVTAKVAALLAKEPDTKLRDRPYTQKPYWHIERARIGTSRKVKVELIVNAQPVAVKEIIADGQLRRVSFETPIAHSSWVALRILQSSHSNPVFVLVKDKPIRASRRSARWCLKGVDQCWSQKERFIAENELKDAQEAYAHARRQYQRILSECEVD